MINKAHRFLMVTIGLLLTSSLAGTAAAETSYTLDPAHSFVEFRIQHLGFSWLYGRFNEMKGSFVLDEKAPVKNRFEAVIMTGSVDTSHAERDKHLRGSDFLDVRTYPEARFKSTSFSGNGEGGTLEGLLTLHGVTKPIRIEIKKVGEGKDPWGGYRAGFIGRTSIRKSDFGILYDLGPSGDIIEFELGIEGIRK